MFQRVSNLIQILRIFFYHPRIKTCNLFVFLNLFFYF
nr:MAG TPA: hypothetical protein [Caudoviricetes sp.]